MKKKQCGISLILYGSIKTPHHCEESKMVTSTFLDSSYLVMITIYGLSVIWINTVKRAIENLHYFLHSFFITVLTARFLERGDGSEFLTIKKSKPEADNNSLFKYILPPYPTFPMFYVYLRWKGYFEYRFWAVIWEASRFKVGTELNQVIPEYSHSFLCFGVKANSTILTSNKRELFCGLSQRSGEKDIFLDHSFVCRYH